MLMLMRQQMSLKSTVPWTVDTVARDTCHPGPLLAGAGQRCRLLKQQGRIVVRVSDPPVQRMAVAPGAGLVTRSHSSDPSPSFQREGTPSIMGLSTHRGLGFLFNYVFL